ncbi:P-loop containing nucleoside triphosphate hydrolase [Glarea lozoyensis ATCC 20868]|uniref:p-loop containing nucleoside triphosphate hydrolase n=1 Tax=Glarea lozoyensis (strain ATCC 20868 / MF5171) TaxID=1116229 RepID=S3E799_GLAL2|nr:P-loop containing nucleoside triphosphate hydrolase [Glarea lozoyensis ATCC 20868]EPE34203.1 P-loop containing nucleoside triphosphate hydrolase [Glarea lozoyensis ATCC 20868]
MAPNGQDSGRTRRLAKELQKFLNGTRKVLGIADAKLFLEALLLEVNPRRCVETIFSSKAKLDPISESVRADISRDFIQNYSLRFVEYISDPGVRALADGAFLNDLIMAIIYPPTFWNAVVQICQNNGLSENSLQQFSWLSYNLLCIPHEKGIDYSADVQSIIKIFTTATNHETRSNGYKIEKILQTKLSKQPNKSAFSPGGRHDNDFEDFRKIRIYPTTDEFLSTKQQYYLQSKEVEEKSESDRTLAHLENQFRLLREDMLGELRTGLQVALGKKKGRSLGISLGNLSIAGLNMDGEQPCLALHCGLGLERLTKLDMTVRKKFLMDSKNFLKHDSFGALLGENDIHSFAHVNRDVDYLLRDPPVVLLQFPEDESFKRALMALKTFRDLRFTLVNTPVFAYQPILESLKKRTEVPIDQNLLFLANGETTFQPLPAQKLMAEKIMAGRRDDGSVKTRIDGKRIELDETQAQSVINGLICPLTVIRGPPGTGKSFLGSFLVKLILKYTDLKILVVSFKNHALDDFLEELLNLGVNPQDMVRLGSKARSTVRTEPLLLHHQKNSRSSETWGMINALDPEVDELKEELQRAFHEFGIGTHSLSWNDIQDYLEMNEEDRLYYDALTIPEENDGWNRVAKKNKRVRHDYLYLRWKSGDDAGIFAQIAKQAFPSVWAMPMNSRSDLVRKWTRSLFEERVELIQDLYKRYTEVQEKLNSLRLEGKIATLRNMRVIGCTTTIAAKQNKLIRGANPDIVLVEEAGEILESHILTALTQSVKQLILIGDDKQLRPRINNYALSVEKKAGYDLNRSLFERLILGGHEHTTLRKQHRMHPEISVLIRELTYPDLIDGPNTTDRERPRGIQGRVVFVNHTHPEIEPPVDIVDRRDPERTSSKQNDFEAKMVLKLVRYLSQQGYGSEELVVLTPYLGQLRLLQEELKQENDPWLNELDSFELLQADNYQGEESDIVIVSLTRSNEKGEIGFMDAPERLNVLLSRARCCLIMIGSEETFMASKKGGAMWTKFLQSLKAKKCLHDGVPVRCEKHPEKEYLLKEPADFDRCCPDGGCSEPCGKPLKCGIHSCVKRCHRVENHSKVECTQIVERTCDKGHKARFPCSKANDTCRKCVQAQKELERRTRRDFELEKHRLEDLERRTRRDFELEKHRLEVQARYAEELKAIQDETEHHKRLNKIAEEEKQAKRNLDQSKADLEALKEASARSNALKAAEKKRELEREKRKAEQQTKTPARAPSKDPNQPWSPPATAKEEWELLKQTDLARSGPMDELMEMIGLEDVKQEFLSIKSRVDTAVRQGVSLSKERFGCSLLGNPGTGKTTVARLYAKFLTSVGVIAGTKFEETTGSALANKGVTGCQKLLDDVLNEGGGVIFIDEAYQLTSGNSSGGGAVLDFLLPEVENLTGKIVFVLAGYDKEMESFFSHNPGLPSRFPTNLKFADYTDVELLQILELKINSRYREAMKVEGGLKGLYCRVITRRIGRGRGRPGFGNARAVENTLAIIIKRQAVRLRKERLALALGKPQPDDLLFTKEDVIGPEPSEALRASASWKKLSKLIGLKAVKEAVTSLCDSIVENYKRELEEKPPIEYNLNRVFLGNPGTGKTTVGKLYAGVLGDLGLLSKGDVVLKTPSDFVGSALGHSEQQTKGILAAAEGKVLIIDEAYGLYGGGGVADPYKTAVIDTIVGEVQSVPGDDRCVLLLGYKDQMEEMFQNVNPGLSRRFPMASAFQFDDFDDSELGQILDLKLKDQSFEITDQARTVALEMLNRARNRPNFGNAGEIDILLNTAKARHQTRRTQGLAKYVTKFEAKDFDEDFDRANRSETNVKELFRGTVGQEAIMALLEGYQQTVRTMKNLDLDAKENIPFNFLFRGPPGTGKTTTARKMGKVFYDMGFLATAELIDVSATDLIGQYVGQTGPKVQQLLDKALGKVLFVDEAYRLGEGHFAKEAMDELVDCTTKTKYHKKLVIILAGYEKDINSLMSTNPGLTSRFPEVINFRGLTPVECFTLLTSTLSTQKKVLLSKKVDMDISALENSSEKFRNDMLIHFQILAQLDNWASARDVQTLSKSIFNRAIQNPDDIKRGQIRISGDLIQSECSALISERQSRGQSSMGNILPSVPLREYQVQNPRPPTKTTTRTTSTITKESQTQPEEEQIDSTPTQELAVTDKPKYPTPQRDAGVSDAIWEQLQRDQQAELEKEEEYKALIKARDDATDAERDEIVKRLLEEEARRKKEAEMKEKLALMGRCPVGYEWIKQAGGYRCAGGSHFLSNGQLGV